MQIEDARRAVLARWQRRPRVGLILGTGLGRLAAQIDQPTTIPYAEIPHFSASTVASHAGQLVCGEIHGVPTVAMEGRFHYYEGYSLPQVTFPVRVMRALVSAARPDPRVRRAAIALVVSLAVQMGAGLLNLALLAPVWMQLVHLLLADLAWIALVLLGASALAAPRASTATRPAIA